MEAVYHGKTATGNQDFGYDEGCLISFVEERAVRDLKAQKKHDSKI